MGLTLNRGNNRNRNNNPTVPARNKEYEGVKKEGRAINPYGVNRGDLELGLFDESNARGKENEEIHEQVELKLTQEKDPNDILGLGKQMEEETIGLKLSGQNQITKMARTKNENPWDNPYEDYGMGARSISKPIDHRTYKKREERERHPILIISFIIMIAVFACEIASLAWVSAQKDVDVQYNLMKFVWLYGAVSVVVFLDAVLVNALYKRKLSLILLALILPFVYPLRRGNYTNGHSVTGHVVCWGSLIAYVSVIMMISQAFNNYSVVVQMPDEAIRHKAATVLDQELDGVKVCNRILSNMVLRDVVCEQSEDEEVVFLIGSDNYRIVGTEFVSTGADDVDTKLGFTQNDAGEYELTHVILGDYALTGRFVAYYWDNVLGS